MSLHSTKIGVLGAGQLGRMLAAAALPLAIDLHFLDKDPSFPAGRISRNFTTGDFKSYEDVIAFGKGMDIVTIEIENVNTKALAELENQGVKVYPQASVIEMIKDKGLQKQFYAEHNFPTSEFRLAESGKAIRKLAEEGKLGFPFVQKSRTAGYDGKGVELIRDKADLDKILEAPSVIEDLVDIEKELAITIARNASGDVITYPVVEMIFNPEGNLLDHLLCPAEIDKEVEEACITLAAELMEKLEMVGILAIELFLTKDGTLLINEIAPRTHNSGHHTINACNYSQFDVHLRSILDLPLLPVRQNGVALMWNLLGEPDHIGSAVYNGLEEILDMDGVYVHLYGKNITKPLRKMGHVTIVDENKEGAIAKLNKIKTTLKVST